VTTASHHQERASHACRFEFHARALVVVSWSIGGDKLNLLTQSLHGGMAEWLKAAVC